LGRQPNKIAVIEEKVLGAGLSSRHTAIVWSANASLMAAKMAKNAIQEWKALNMLGVLTFPLSSQAQSGLPNGINQWQQLKHSMQNEGIPFQMIA